MGDDLAEYERLAEQSTEGCYGRAILSLVGEVRDLRAGWVKCSDRLPDKCGTYLMYAESADPMSPLILTVWFEPDRPPEGRWGLVPMWSAAVSHWMPLPAPPADAPEVR